MLKKNEVSDDAPTEMSNGIVGGAECCGRQSARAGLEDERTRHLRTADRLGALLKALPAELPPDADDALWALLMNQRR